MRRILMISMVSHKTELNDESLIYHHLTEVGRTRREDNSVGLQCPAPRPRLAATQGAIHKRLIGQEVLEAGAEASLVVVPLETILLSLAHDDKRLEGETTFTG